MASGKAVETDEGIATGEIADAATEPDSDTGPQLDGDSPFRRQRTALLVLGAVGLLLLGFAVGVLAGMPLGGSSEPEPGPVDIGFSQDMSTHHAQAVAMSGVALANSGDAQVKELAYDILTTQQNQLGRMQAWLQMWEAPRIAPDGHMGWMTEAPDSGHDHGGAKSEHTMSGPVNAMPGMASQEEMAALGRATGAELDVMFLQLMLRHHEGGFPMGDYAAQHAETTAVRLLAESMGKTQRGEAELITRMLAERGAQPLPMN